MSDPFDQATNQEMMHRERSIQVARDSVYIPPVVDCYNTCTEGPYLKDCPYYAECLKDVVHLTERGKTK